MRRFRNKLTILFIVLVGASVLGVGLISANHLKNSLIETMEDGMEREIRTILATVPWDGDGSQTDQAERLSSFAKTLKESSGARVTFISADGMVLGDSDHDYETMDNHIDREEIQQAREQGRGSEIRYSKTLDQQMLYVALPVMQDQQLAGYVRLAFSLEHVEDQVGRTWSFLAWGIVILFLAAGAVSYSIAKSLTKPLETMMDVAQQISHFNYDARVPTQRKDEIGQLGQAINKMAESLQQQVKHISKNETRLAKVLESMISGVILIDQEGKFVLLNRSAEEILGYREKELKGKNFEQTKQPKELTELIKACMKQNERIRDEMVFHYPMERMVEVSLVPLASRGQHSEVVMVLHDITDIRRLEKMRSEFVANVSHELKTPIAAVKGFAETLLSGALHDEETLKSFLQIIYDESARLDRLIMDILELSKIESKRTPLQFSPVHMRSFSQKTVNMLNAEAEKKDIRLEMDVNEELYLEADEDRLRQILLNLLSNGINYTPPGGMVKLSVKPKYESGKKDYDDLQIVVEDTGIGIPKKDLPRIFERFYRVDKARSRSSGGTGLGLSIVKHLVESHQGIIWVESHPGMGSRFIIELPVIQS